MKNLMKRKLIPVFFIFVPLYTFPTLVRAQTDSQLFYLSGENSSIRVKSLDLGKRLQITLYNRDAWKKVSEIIKGEAMTIVMTLPTEYCQYMGFYLLSCNTNALKDMPHLRKDVSMSFLAYGNREIAKVNSSEDGENLDIRLDFSIHETRFANYNRTTQKVGFEAFMWISIDEVQSGFVYLSGLSYPLPKRFILY